MSAVLLDSCLVQGQSTNPVIPRAFKAPTLAANPSYTASATLDIGYVPMQAPDSRQPRSAGYFPDPDISRAPVDTRDYPKRSPPLSTSAVPSPESQRSSRPRTTSFTIKPSSSQRAYVYEASIISKNEDSDEEEDEEDEPDSPSSASSVTTNLSAVIPEFTTTSRSRIEILSNMPSIPVGHIIPPTFDIAPTESAPQGSVHSDSSASTSQAPRRQLPTPPRSNSTGSDSSSSSSQGQGQERSVRSRLMSNAAASRDSAIYPLKAGYSGPLKSGPAGPRMANAEPSRQESQEEATFVDEPESYFSQPPGLDAYFDDPCRPPGFVPHRRNSDGDQAAVLPKLQTGPAVMAQLRSNSTPPSRGVRWNENLICPSPILPSQRRKGWFNRRG